MFIADTLVALRYTHIKFTETSQVQFSHLKSFCAPFSLGGNCGGHCGTDGGLSTST